MFQTVGIKNAAINIPTAITTILWMILMKECVV